MPSLPAPVRWRSLARPVVPMGVGMEAVLSAKGHPHLLPAGAAAWARTCPGWATPAEHLAAAAREHGWTAEEHEHWQAAWPALAEAGLFFCADGLFPPPDPARAEPGAAISLVGLPTGGAGGAALLARALESYGRHLEEQGRRPAWVLAGVAGEPASVAAGRALRLPGGEAPLYLGPEESAALCARLAERGLCPPEAAAFAFGDPFRLGYTPGANRNLLLLAGAGRLLACFDHDTLARFRRAPGAASHPGDRLCLAPSADPLRRWLRPTLAEALAFPEETPDFLGEHEKLLGRRPASRQWVPERASEALLRRLEAGPARVRATYAGLAGAPGLPGQSYPLQFPPAEPHLLGEGLVALASGEGLMVSPEWALTEGNGTPGVGCAFDHRELLPPFWPALRAEDYLHSSLVSHCCPDSLLGLLPWAVEHRPEPGRRLATRAEVQREPPFVVWEFALLLRSWIESWPLAPRLTAAQRLRRTGGRLREIATLPAADFAGFLRCTTLPVAGGEIARLEAAEANGDLPLAWRREAGAWRDHLQATLLRPGWEIPRDLRARAAAPEAALRLGQELLAAFAGVLEAWPEIIHAARTEGLGLPWLESLRAR